MRGAHWDRALLGNDRYVGAADSAPRKMSEGIFVAAEEEHAGDIALRL